jgi:hypothetical protein
LEETVNFGGEWAGTSDALMWVVFGGPDAKKLFHGLCCVFCRCG